MIKNITLRTVRYTEHMSEKAREVVDKFNHYAEEISGAIEDHLNLVPIDEETTYEDMIESGYYEYASENPYFGELNSVFEALENVACPYHDTCCWLRDILDVFHA